jgi:hypothetical protein
MLSEYTITLPTLHPGQIDCWSHRSRFYAVRCGRRWGKTLLMITAGSNASIHGYPVGIFAPDYKILTETYSMLVDILGPVIKSASSPKGEGVIRLVIPGGRIDFWSLENERAGRSRKYKLVLIDEGAYGKPNLFHIWRTAIRPTLIDLEGSCMVLSNTNGADPDNFLYKICTEPKHGFTEYHAPSHSNPFLPPEELELMRTESHPLVYQQEVLADFVDWSGVAFFSLEKLLREGSPLPYPEVCDCVFAVMDTAVKTGKDNDGTGIVYFALSRYLSPYPLQILDYDICQIEGSFLDQWVPNVVVARLNELAQQCRPRYGSLGLFVEDAGIGSVLVAHLQRNDIKANTIETALTAKGKDERAVNVSGYVYQGKVKLTDYAFKKMVNFKGSTRNHLVSQVTGFRMGDKKAATRADDLLDCFTYGIALTLGDTLGI